MMLLRAFLSHYRRHPFQLASLAVMIMLATMLWTGVTILTDQARSSLSQSEKTVQPRVHVVRSDGKPIGVDDFAALRKAGACVAPWLEIERAPPEGRVIGIDPLAMNCFGESAPAGDANTLDGAPFLDISEAVRLAGDNQNSRLYLLAADRNVQLPTGYALREFSMGPPTGELADSFLLNLDALSLLVLLITGLLIRSVHRLGIAQRQTSFDLLYRFGVSRRRIRQLLALELVTLTAMFVLPGLWLGAQLAGMLGSGFGQALDSLFDVTLYAGHGGALPWHAAGVIILLVLAVCLIDAVVPSRWQQTTPSFAWQGAAAALVLAGVISVAFAIDLVGVFAGTALVFIGVGWLTPGLLAAMAERLSDSNALAGSSSGPLTRWRRRELAVMFRQLALPVVALQFAMAAVLAVHALVTTFEHTFEQWLGQRLEAEFYVEVPQGADAGLAAQRLQTLDGIGDWHRVRRGKARISAPEAGDPSAPLVVDLMALAPVSDLVTQWSLLAAVERPWQRLAKDNVMVNEQLARRQGLELGDTLKARIGDGTSSARIVAIYADYGRPAGEVLMAGQSLPAGFNSRFESFSVNTGELTIADIRGQLAEIWGTSDVNVRDNASVRALASQVFGQTFLLTRAISLLTLMLAAVALLVMSWVFFTTRVWYFRLLGIWGLPSKHVRGQLQRLSVALTLAITLAALPLGIWLTWVLVSRINPLAFGWSLPMALYPLFWLELGLIAAFAGLVVAHLMRRQLVRLKNGEKT